MGCKICNHIEYIDILKKRAIPIWTGTSKIEDDFYICNLKQCTQCGHVYEEAPPELADKLTNIYRSSHAQASTPPGDGNWGLQRAEKFLNKINYKQYSSAIEIGCADGYLLKFLENHNYTRLIGIEPSLPNSHKVGKIEFINEFANEETMLKVTVDLIFSNAVFEHIEDINGVLQFCNNHLNKKGELFFAVPNAQIELENNDPALFIHEHVHYYTKDSLEYLLAKNGFQLKSIVQECSATYVCAVLNNTINLPKLQPKLYTRYTNILEERLRKFKNTMLTNDAIIVHGANNKLNNILGWIGDEFIFTLVDNDEKKCGQDFFNREVQAITSLNLNNYNCVVIIPTCFYKAIKEKYIELGFKGKFYDV